MTCAFSFCYGQLDKIPPSLSCQINVDGNNLTLTGQYDNVMTTRAELLNSYPTKVN
jgi:hypothetical protein